MFEITFYRKNDNRHRFRMSFENEIEALRALNMVRDDRTAYGIVLRRGSRVIWAETWE